MTRVEGSDVSGWTVRPIGDLIACPARLRERVFDLGPSGCVHEALIAADEIPHPDMAGGEDAQEWIGRTDWCFAAWLRADRSLLACERIDLVIEHVDTLADVLLNGVRVAAVGNEFVPLRIPVRAFVRGGMNEVEVRVRGPVSAVRSLERSLGPRPVNGDWTPFSFLRKSACNFGWDWGPRVPTAGVGRVRLEGWSGARLCEIRPLVTRCDDVSAVVEVFAHCEETGEGDLSIRCELESPDGHRVEAVGHVANGRARIELSVAQPRRWWPRGHGDQPLYLLRAVLERSCAEIDRRECRIGLRSVELRRERDADGESFAICVNDRPIWCRGANWIPVDLFPRSAKDERVRAWIDAAAEANLNMLRVWGGGLYERDSFYDRCDELGILVWQDFMFACATYPESDPYPALIEAEARYHVTRLSAHPSVVLWCGGNEDVLAWWSWGWRERLADGQAWGKRYWFDLLPAIVEELDPTRPYWHESPYSGSMDVHPNDPSCGDRHTWDLTMEAYRSIVPRFCSEFGHQSPPSLATLAEALPSESLAIGSAELATRQRAWGGDAVQYAPLLEKRFPPLRSLDDWIFAAQLLQARAYEIAIGWMRANAPRCMGALFWQWNDVWRGHSWSVWDAAGRPKPAYFSVQRAAAAEHLCVLPPSDVERMGRVVLCSAQGECGAPVSDGLVRLLDERGIALDERRLRLVGEAGWRRSAQLPAEWFEVGAAAMICADVGDLRACLRVASERERPLPPPAFDLEVGGQFVRVTARSLLVDLVVLPERAGFLNSRATRGMLTLLPGERADFGIVGPAISARASDAVRCANQLWTTQEISTAERFEGKSA